MKSTPILMSTWSMQRYLAGAKTQTRRMNGLGKINQSPDEWILNACFLDGLTEFKNKITDKITMIQCPYGGIGDELWFRETWKYMGEQHIGNGPILLIEARTSTTIKYAADGTYKTFEDISIPFRKSFAREGYQSAMFMFKWASRFPHVPVTGLRCERLQSITEADAIAEGCDDRTKPTYPGAGYDEYLILWDSINGKKYPAKMNPWVWVPEFPKYEAVR